MSNRSGMMQRRPWPLRAARRGALFLALAASVAAYAGTASGSFRVRVDLFTDVKDTVDCDRTSSGGNVSVACVPRDGSDTTRFMLQVFRADHWLGDVDATVAAGTVTSWSVVRGSDREYVEIVVGW